MVRKNEVALAKYLEVMSRNVRKIRGSMSQAAFARKAGISTATIHRIESCKNFQVDSILKIAISFGVFPYELCLTEEERNRLHLRTDVLVESFKEVIKKEIIAELKKNNSTLGRKG
jgi:transcriptional regulator with XRE-family HTH domain